MIYTSILSVYYIVHFLVFGLETKVQSIQCSLIINNYYNALSIYAFNLSVQIVHFLEFGFENKSSVQSFLGLL